MRFKVIVEQRQTGIVEAEVPDEKWERHTDKLYRRKMVKQAAAKALADDAEIKWLEPDGIEATTSFAEVKEW